MRILDEENKKGRRLMFFVNLMGQIFSDPGFVGRIIRTLEEYDIDPGQISFELTERAAVGNIHTARTKMEALREYGFKFAIDDFGSGFSSFTYLKHMPVDCVKIEGEFVERQIEDDVDRAMVKSMIDIAKACGKSVVAEYVSDQESINILKSYGVDYLQGYFIAEPSTKPESALLKRFLPDNVAVLNTAYTKK